MPYALAFRPDALKEWRRLDSTVRVQFEKKIAERLQTPRVPKDKLTFSANHYKIKLRAIGYRLVYMVDDGVLVITVVAVGRRDKSAVYDAAADRS